MRRRNFLTSIAAVPGIGLLRPAAVEAAPLPRGKITRVRIFEPPAPNPLFNQSNMVCTVETDFGLTGIGEGGSKDTLEQCAGTLIGKDPFKIEAIWQEMFIAWFYPPGREKTHALGAMDLALWDIKGKALGLPVHEILGGAVRNYCECYGTTTVVATGRPATLADRAKAAIDAGYRAFRMGAADAPVGGVFNTHDAVRAVIQQCKEVRQGVGPKGDWCIDFHQRFDFNDGLRACRGIEEFEPYFVEDPVLDQHALQDLPKLRQMTTRAAHAWRGVGPPVGLQQARREPRHRLHSRHAAQRRRHHRDDEGRGDLRDARRGDRAALHGADRDGRAGELSLDLLGARHDGIQLRRASHRLSARSVSTGVTGRPIPTSGPVSA